MSWWTTGSAIDRGGPVCLTLAGLHHVHDDQAVSICRALLAYMRALTKAQEQILTSPFEVPDLTVDLRDAVQAAGEDLTFLDWTVKVAEREWPGIAFTPQLQEDKLTGTLGHLTEANFHTTDAYLTAVTAALAPPEPPTTLPYSEPRALLRALNFLDVTHELVVGSPLVERPPMDRSSLLVLSAQTEAEFNAGVTALSELLGNFNVPKTRQQPPHALSRLEEHLATELPNVDRSAVREAVDTLNQIRVLRNSSVHPKPAPELLQAHERLGLTFPVNDFATAWDSVRAYAERACASLQEEIQAART